MEDWYLALLIDILYLDSDYGLGNNGEYHSATGRLKQNIFDIEKNRKIKIKLKDGIIDLYSIDDILLYIIIINANEPRFRKINNDPKYLNILNFNRYTKTLLLIDNMEGYNRAKKFGYLMYDIDDLRKGSEYSYYGQDVPYFAVFDPNDRKHLGIIGLYVEKPTLILLQKDKL